MNISSVSSTSNNTYASASGSNISQLKAEKAKLQAQLQKINSSSADEKTKQAEAAEIQAEIQQISMEIQQAQSSNTNQGSSQQVESLTAAASKSGDNLLDVLA